MISPEVTNSEEMTSQAERSPKESHALVMKGGGIKGLAYVGALKELEKYYEFDWFVGTSAGAITAVLLAAGYTTEELETILSKTNFRKFLDARFYEFPANYRYYGGLYSGEEIKKWVDELLSKKLLGKTRGIRQVLLRDLPKRVTIYASRKDQDVLEFDSKTRETWENPAAHAVRCSMTIPFFFQPPQHHGGDVFDGGLQNNYPVDAFLRSHPDTRFVGLYLTPEKPGRIMRRLRLLSQVLSILTESADIRALDAHFDDTVIIDPQPIGTLQFGVQGSEKDFLLKVGRAAALSFLANQNFPNGPTLEAVTRAAEEAEEARARVYEMRSRRRRRRLALILGTTLLLVAMAVTWTFWLRKRQPNSNINAPIPSATTNQVPSPELIPTPVPESSRENSPARPVSSPNKQGNDNKRQVAQHISRARSLYAGGQYQAALRECDNALRLDPKNREVLALKKRIQNTIDILNP